MEHFLTNLVKQILYNSSKQCLFEKTLKLSIDNTCRQSSKNVAFIHPSQFIRVNKNNKVQMYFFAFYLFYF